MNLSIIKKKIVISLVLVIVFSLPVLSQQKLWVGQSYTFDVSSSVMGLTANMSWSTSGGYLSLSGSGFYRTITVTQYFSGTATVTCEWDYKLTSNGSYTHTKRQVSISCRDNQVSISPTSMTLSYGEKSFVSYHHQHNNQYTSAANAYFQSTNPLVASVNQHTGEVTAIKEGTAYINVYSKISSVAPYCLVTVKKSEPITVSLPTSMVLENGERRTLSPVLTPEYAETSYTWTSSNTEVATVSSSGEVKAIKHGYADISVKTSNGLKATCRITVEEKIIDKEIDNIFFSLYIQGENSYYAKVVGNNISSPTQVTIPALIKNDNIDYPVTVIGHNSFSDCENLLSIIIPSSVVKIEYYSFSHCKSLTSISIPNSVTEIGIGAFRYCINLKSVDLPKSLSRIEHKLFEYCHSLKNISIPNTVTYIGGAAFFDSGIESIVLPKSVTEICSQAFDYCENLKKVYIPSSVVSIVNNVFANSINLEEIYYNANSFVVIRG